jgi:hypothetical protein
MEKLQTDFLLQVEAIYAYFEIKNDISPLSGDKKR